MFLEVKIVDMADPQAKDHTGYFLASEVVAVLPKRLEMNAIERQKEPKLLPRYMEVTVIATRQGGQFVTREDIAEILERIRVAVKA